MSIKKFNQEQGANSTFKYIVYFDLEKRLHSENDLRKVRFIKDLYFLNSGMLEKHLYASYPAG